MPLDATKSLRSLLFRVLASCLAVLVLASTVTAPAAAPGAVLLPHVARYNLSRNRADADSGVAGVKGMMEIRVDISCDGYRIDQYLGFHVLSEDETQFEHLAYLSSFEDAEGENFWFDARTYENRELTDELAGSATIGEAEAGELRYAKPERLKEALPEGTVFPVRHLIALIDAARKGEKSLRRTVFDGSTKENPFEVSTFIGRESKSGNRDVAALRGLTFWPMRLAYYQVGAVNLAPEFEMSADVYENGVIGNMIYDYGNFAIDVTLQEVEALPKPDC